MKITSLILLIIVLQSTQQIINVNGQIEEIFLNIPLVKENQKENELTYMSVDIEEKIKDLQLTFVATGRDQQSEPELSIYIVKQGTDLESLIKHTTQPNYICKQSRNNICVVPENNISNDDKITILITVQCFMKCSYSFEASYTEMRQFQMNSDFQYQKLYYNQEEDTTTFSGWFEIPKDQKLLEVKLTVYELFPNAKNIPIHIYMNPGKKGITGNQAKYESIQGMLNSALLRIHESEIKESNEFSFIVSFASSSIILIRLESSTGDIVKLNINEFTQNELNQNEKMIYKIINPTGINRIDPTNKSLVITLLCQQGYGLIKLAGKEIPKSENEFILTTSENIHEQQLVVSEEMRKTNNLGDDLFYLMIQPVSSYMLYIIDVSYENENKLGIEELEFRLQTHKIVNSQSFNEFKLIISGNSPFDIELKAVHKEGQSTMIIKRCSQGSALSALANCELIDSKMKELIESEKITNEQIQDEKNPLINISERKAIHDIKFISKQDECEKINGHHLCVYYIAIINHEKSKSRYMLLAEHSDMPTIINDSEFVYGSVLTNKYKYYSYQIPSENNIHDTIQYIKIVLSTTSNKTYIGANISSKSKSDKPTKENADIYYKSSFLIIRSSDFGKLSEQTLSIFVYSEEIAIYNIQVTYHIADQQPIKNLILNQYTTDIIDSYEARGLYAINLWLYPNSNADLKIMLKGISGDFYFEYCKNIVKNTMKDCIQSSSNQITIPKSELKNATFQAYVQVFPVISSDKEMIKTHSNLQYKIGCFFTDFANEISKNESYTMSLKVNEVRYGKVMISSGDNLRIFMSSDNETPESDNAIAYFSYDYQNIRPHQDRNNQVITSSNFLKIDSQLSESICSTPVEKKIECYIYIAFTATKKNTQIIFNANKQESIVRLYNGIVHKDEYPENNDSYHRYYMIVDKNMRTILQTYNPLSQIDIYINMVSFEKDKESIYADDETYYPTNEKHHYRLSTGDPTLNTIDLDDQLFDVPQNSQCKSQQVCIFLISMKLNEISGIKNLKEEYYSVKVFSNQIVLQKQNRQIYVIKKGYNYFFKLSILPDEKQSIIHVNPIGMCDVSTSVLKLGQKDKYSYTEKGGNLIVIDQKSVGMNQKLQGDYLITVSTNDSLCQFYIVNYDSPYQYVKIEAGHYFHSHLNINQQLFLEYTDLSPLSFRVETSVEEGSVKIGIASEKKSLQWNPQMPIIWYEENNLKSAHKQTLVWKKEKHGFCDRCKFIIAIRAVREARLSIVVKNDSTFTNVPAQRMFKIEGEAHSNEYLHFYPNNQLFEMQITLLSGKIKVFAQEGFKVVATDYTSLFYLSGTYQSKQITFRPSNFNNNQQKHTLPYSFLIRIDEDSVFLISFQTNFKAMHLASGFPYFKELDPYSEIELQYKSMESGYSKSTEFSVHFQDQIYTPSGYSLVTEAMQSYAKKSNFNSIITWNDFYPSITIEDNQFQKNFIQNQLSKSVVLFSRESESGTFTIKIKNDGKGLIELNRKIMFYVIAHSGVQHLISNQLIQKTALQGSFDNYEYYDEGNLEIIIELVQCFGESILTISDDLTDSLGSREFEVIASHPNLYVAKIEQRQQSSNDNNNIIQGNSYFLKVQNLLESEYRIRSNAYPLSTNYPYQMYTSGDIFVAEFNPETKKLDITFEGLKCSIGCSQQVFQLIYISYVFDSDYHSINKAQGNGLCSKLDQKHLYNMDFDVNTLENILNNKIQGNEVDHSNLKTSIAIDHILDKQAAKERAPQFYLSLVAKAVFFNSQTKSEQEFYFPYKTHTLDIEWIEKQKSKSHYYTILVLIILGSIILAALIGYFLYRWYKKSRRNIRFEMSDANSLNNSSVTSRHHSLQVNLNHNLEMNNYKQNYSEFKDDLDTQV